MKNSFKISKNIFILKLKVNFLEFSVLLLKESNLRYTKKSKIRALLEELLQFNKKAILQKFMIPYSE